jgi:uncharacterized protein YijF (DUF1287 family)
MIKSLIIFVLVFGCVVFASAQENFYHQLADSALTLTHDQVVYDPGYYTMDYPNGDVPEDRGVCTDVIIRAYRKMGIDLQKEVHEDIKANFNAYPNIWGLTSTDKNIDHRRVPNLMTFFERNGEVKIISSNPIDYAPGAIVCWHLGGGVTHIGLVSNLKSDGGTRYLVIHNIGAGQVVEDCLFHFEIIGHYRYNK